MPLPLIPLITAGSSLLGQGFNALSQGSINRKMRDFQREMYERQRVDSLNDWEMQNEYNSPANQMKRFVEAGLNPNLVYGSANNDTATVRSSSPGNWNPSPSSVDMSAVTQPLMSIYDVQVKQATTDNLKQQLETAKQQTLLTAAQTASTIANTAKTGVDTDMGKFNLGQAQSLSNTVLEKARADLDKTLADTKFTLDANDRAAALQGGNLQQQVENILNSRSQRATNTSTREQIGEQIKNMRSSRVLMDLDAKLKRDGIQPTDPAYMRMISQLMSGEGGIIENAKKMLQNLQNKATNVADGIKNWFNK